MPTDASAGDKFYASIEIASVTLDSLKNYDPIPLGASRFALVEVTVGEIELKPSVESLENTLLSEGVNFVTRSTSTV